MLRLKAACILVMLSLAFSASAQEEQIHTVTYGDNLFRIAQQYGVDVDAIAQANNIVNTWRIDVGQQLIIPRVDASGDIVAETPVEVLPQEPLAEPTAVATEAPTEYYTVGYGQSLAQIARSFGMSITELASLNDIANPDLIYAGQRLIVSGSGASTTDQTPIEPQPTSDPALPSNTVTHLVQPGENLASIAQRYGISWLQIAQANNIYDADYVSAGEELLIPGGSVLPGAEFSFVSAPAAPAARIGVGKEIIVDLSDSRTYAYEDGKLIRNVLSSTGLPATPTVQGSFTIQRKYAAQTMTGPGYYLPDVPYVMYFYGGYALHGTFWHNNFGQRMSHGCVNLPTPEAGWFYDWSEIGTPVYVQL